jgi:hypothetical protein
MVVKMVNKMAALREAYEAFDGLDDDRIGALLGAVEAILTPDPEVAS